MTCKGLLPATAVIALGGDSIKSVSNGTHEHPLALGKGVGGIEHG